MKEMEKTGLVFEWEFDAMAGKPTPDGLDYPERAFYRSLRDLYHQHKNGVISRSTAIKEKLMMIQEYKRQKESWEIVQMFSDMIKRTEKARGEYRKNRTLENADKLVEAIDGIKIKTEDK